MRRKGILLALVVCFSLSAFICLGTSKSFAASYPLVVPEEYELEVCAGETASIVYNYYPAFNNEQLDVDIYDEDGYKVATSSRQFSNKYASSIQKYTLNWDTTDNEPGRYTAVVTKHFYSLYRWNTAPSQTSSYVVVKDHDKKKALVKAATATEDGSIKYTCSRCGNTETVAIPKVSDLTLPYISIAYDGKVKTPSVKLYDSKDKLLVKGTDYDLKYSDGRTNAGTYKVTATLKGNYSGTITKTFKITPVKVTAATLGATEYVYNGKVKTPTVTVKAGKTVVANKATKSNGNVTLTYAAGRKNVGTYKVTVKGKGNYTGTITKTFKVKPQGTAINKFNKNGKKQFTAKWNKKTVQVNGYQIRYSTKQNMTGAKTKLVAGAKTGKVTIKNLKAKKKYWVQIRTYKNVNGTKYYSAWSAKKTVITK